ncbi:MAG: CBS domain-containing protein [Planctomycetota bacterium]
MKVSTNGDGRSLQQPVSSLMTREVKYCRPEDNLEKAIRHLWDEDCGFVPVVHELSMELAGVITDRDACIAMWSRGQGASEIDLESAMSRNIVSVKPEDTIARAHELMRDHRVRRLPVLGARRELLGVLSLCDLVRAAAEMDGSEGRSASIEVTRTLAAICQPVGEPMEISEPEPVMSMR